MLLRSGIGGDARQRDRHLGSVAFLARDLERLTSFYQDLLGLTVQERTDRIARLVVPGSSLIISDNKLSDETGKYTDLIVQTR